MRDVDNPIPLRSALVEGMPIGLPLRVHPPLDLAGVVFAHPVDFTGSVFQRDVDFSRCTFQRGADFSGCAFEGKALFEGVTGNGPIVFDGARFQSWAYFEAANIDGDLSFLGATFATARNLGDLRVEGHLRFDMATFQASVKLRMTTHRATFARADFREGARISALRGDLALDDASFGRPTVIDGDRGARVVSVRQADVSQLVLSGLDVRACLFAGAHGLDGLRMERVEFARAPGAVLSRGREAIAEEHRWRTTRGWRRRRRAWRTDVAESPAWLGQRDPATGEQPGRIRPPDTLQAREVAEIYRRLRKGREDAKDTPGAADFYFGEMEMRRRGLPAGLERALLSAYRLTSGYALRGDWAILWLIAVVALAAIGFGAVGFRNDRSPYAPVLAPAYRIVGNDVRPVRPAREPVTAGETLTYTLATATGVAPPSDLGLTAEGRWLRFVLRILGPIFVALTILGVRGRVKR